MLGRTKIRPGVATANLTKGIVDVPIEVHAVTKPAHDFDVLRGFDHAPAAGDEQAPVMRERLERPGLQQTELGFAICLEDLSNAHPHLSLNHAIGVDKPAIEHAAEVARESRFARTQKPDEEDVVAAALHYLIHCCVHPFHHTGGP